MNKGKGDIEKEREGMRQKEIEQVKANSIKKGLKHALKIYDNN